MQTRPGKIWVFFREDDKIRKLWDKKAIVPENSFEISGTMLWDSGRTGNDKRVRRGGLSGEGERDSSGRTTYSPRARTRAEGSGSAPRKRR